MRVGDQLGPYVIDSQLGRGAMASVYKARCQRTDRLVALKVLTPAQARLEDGVTRFGTEWGHARSGTV